MKKNINIIIYALIGLIVLVAIYLFVGGENNSPQNTLVFELYGEEYVNIFFPIHVYTN